MMDVVTTINAGGDVVVEAGDYTVPINVIRPPANSRVTLTGVTLRIEPNAAKRYFVIELSQANVQLIGGTLIGDKGKHLGKDGQAGMGVWIKDGAENVKVKGVKSHEMWADGFYIGGGKNITLENCEADKNRRQGLSIVHGRDIKVLRSRFQQTGGTNPQAGIDIEPDSQSKGVSDVLIDGCTLKGNAGCGILVQSQKGPVKGVSVRNCSYSGNKGAPLQARSLWSWWERMLFDMGVWKPTEL